MIIDLMRKLLKLMGRNKILPYVRNGQVRYYTARQTNLTTDSPVGTWLDEVIADDAVQPIGSKQAFFRATGLNGKPGLEFDGGLMEYPFGPLSLSHNSWTIVIVGKFGGSNYHGTLSNSATGGVNNFYIGANGVLQSGIVATDVNSTAIWTLPNINDTPAILQIRGDYTVRLNNTPISLSYDVHTDTALEFDTIGYETDGGAFLNGFLGEVIIYNRNLTNAELALNYQAFRSRYL